MYPEHMRKNANLFCVLLTGVCLYRILNEIWFGVPWGSGVSKFCDTEVGQKNQSNYLCIGNSADSAKKMTTIIWVVIIYPSSTQTSSATLEGCGCNRACTVYRSFAVQESLRTSVEPTATSTLHAHDSGRMLRMWQGSVQAVLSLSIAALLLSRVSKTTLETSSLCVFPHHGYCIYAEWWKWDFQQTWQHFASFLALFQSRNMGK